MTVTVDLKQVLLAAVRSACGWRVCRDTSTLVDFCQRYGLGTAEEVMLTLYSLLGQGVVVFNEVVDGRIIWHVSSCPRAKED